MRPLFMDHEKIMKPSKLGELRVCTSRLAGDATEAQVKHFARPRKQSKSSKYNYVEATWAMAHLGTNKRNLLFKCTKP